jgi:hypothetical protein
VQVDSIRLARGGLLTALGILGARRYRRGTVPASGSPL